MTDKLSQPDNWLSLADYAHAYNVDRRTVLKWIANDLVTHWRVGRIIRIHNSPPVTNPLSIDIREHS